MSIHALLHMLIRHPEVSERLHVFNKNVKFSRFYGQRRAPDVFSVSTFAAYLT